MIPNLYEKTAGIYDIVLHKEVLDDDLDFYRSLINPGQSVADIGCGTGRVSLELAKIGCQVTGVDLSESMLNEFQKKIPEQYADRIHLLCRDMKALDLPKEFDWIIFPYRVFQAMQNHDDRVACLESVKKSMGPNSRVVITLFNPSPVMLENWGTPETQGMVDLEVSVPGENCSIRRTSSMVSHNKEQQTLRLELLYQKYDDTGLIEEMPDILELAYLFPGQSEALFLSLGFVIENAYGTYNCEPIVEGVYQEQIYVLKCN